MNYQSILKRIEEIINLSKELIGTTPEDEFVNLRHFMIHMNYAEEFKELLDTERTYYLLNKVENPSLRNDELLAHCEQHINVDVLYNEEYMTIIEILRECYGKNANQLVEYCGYYVLKDKLEMFLNACRTLKNGPFVKLNELTKEEAAERINTTLNNNTEQFKRIKKYLSRNDVQEEKKEPTMKIVSDIDELVEYFTYRKPLNIDAFKLLIPHIGIYNFHYLIDNLYKNGAISFESYKAYLEEFNFIPREQKNKSSN